MNWLLFSSQLPTHPSSLRVNVWRKLRAVGALGLQNGVWLLPDRPDQTQFLAVLLEWIQKQGASGQIFRVAPLDAAVEQDILSRFRTEREEEYIEFLERCQEFLAEIEKESGKQKYTFAELEENEQDLQRLEGWFEKIVKRDFTGGEVAGQSAVALEKCRASFEVFSNEVYDRQASVPGQNLNLTEK
ncbi:hypothetical protein LARV_03504 [Longilinea arvoryzae]|uniref:ChrB N-terminal domain-containing protein n=1 Tax=Longilinea arvoryzae TaxID=360412 RepID=A0A0S7BKS1_9CHLR|nr:Chromate resistance protein ChrB [Longilinea arvoryzae]GAP15712.1 hypothetical protein LARV_03504 [Longilinea arvoryzae]